MSGFDVEKFKRWQVDVAGSLSTIAKLAKATGTSDEYVLAMVFGCGAMAATTIVREVLESGELPGSMSLSLTLADAFDKALSHEETYRQMYDMANGKEH